MKRNVFVFFCILFAAAKSYCAGNLELVNTEEINLDNITDIKILYSSDKVSLFMGTTEALVIKEYMNENNKKYFANITNTGNTLTVEKGRTPFRLFLNFFSRRVEVYLPLSYKNIINIKSGSGKIESTDNLFCGNINIENSSGSIVINAITADKINIKNSSGGIFIDSINGESSVKTSSGNIKIQEAQGVLTAESSSGSIRGDKINGNVNLRAKSGDIVFNYIDGDVSAQTTSGLIALNLVTGSVSAKTTSGSARCLAAPSAGDLSVTTRSGNVRLDLSKKMRFSFSAWTSSGTLRTPFTDKLVIPLADKHLTQGIIGGTADSENIPAVNIRTSSGSITINWAD